MSKVLQQRLENCDNRYTVEDLYDHFGMYDEEVRICMNCNNHRMEGGIITCKYILDGFDKCCDRGDE